MCFLAISNRASIFLRLCYSDRLRFYPVFSILLIFLSLSSLSHSTFLPVSLYSFMFSLLNPPIALSLFLSPSLSLYLPPSPHSLFLFHYSPLFFFRLSLYFFTFLPSHSSSCPCPPLSPSLTFTLSHFRLPSRILSLSSPSFSPPLPPSSTNPLSLTLPHWPPALAIPLSSLPFPVSLHLLLLPLLSLPLSFPLPLSIPLYFPHSLLLSLSLSDLFLSFYLPLAHSLTVSFSICPLPPFFSTSRSLSPFFLSLFLPPFISFLFLFSIFFSFFFLWALLYYYLN